MELSAECGLMLVIGTSALVYPAASLPRIARQSGAVVAEINTTMTSLTGDTANITVYGGASEVFTDIHEMLTM
ncbi:MAG: hypothetical protein R6U17_02650 [Thermoplasmata archaeon]